jgi:hypothetical protein
LAPAARRSGFDCDPGHRVWIDDWVSQTLREGDSLFDLDGEEIRRLRRELMA